ncbi:hypothetical protein [Campylobacter sp. CCS1377]|uniref:TPM domain-containing protein n=1 Tax=Campylobacter sp. CCS1377 TaxID=3158229 RepID=A0AAU7E6C9_9BACT|nr:hypothetical protein [Campylobacter jejuni]
MKFLIQSGFLAAFFFINSLLAQGNSHVVFNENVLNDKVVNELNLMGNELYEKTGVFVAAAISDKTDFNELLKFKDKLPSPFILLVLSKKSHQLDIIATKEALVFFDKEKVLSPYPWSGSILPLLSSNKAKDQFNAAVLNGYSDIVDQVASYFNIKLVHSIGNANRDTLNVLRIGIYGFICIMALLYIQKKMRRKKNV